MRSVGSWVTRSFPFASTVIRGAENRLGDITLRGAGEGQSYTGAQAPSTLSVPPP